MIGDDFSLSLMNIPRSQFVNLFNFFHQLILKLFVRFARDHHRIDIFFINGFNKLLKKILMTNLRWYHNYHLYNSGFKYMYKISKYYLNNNCKFNKLTLPQFSAIINCWSDVMRKKNSFHASLYKGSVFCKWRSALDRALKSAIAHSSGSVMNTCSSLCYNGNNVIKLCIRSHL